MQSSAVGEMGVRRFAAGGRRSEQLLQVSDTAYVQFSRGEWVMPARSRYDRQLLREHVSTLAQRVHTLRLGLDGQQWTVTRLGEILPSCTVCALPRGRLHCCREDDAQPTCIECVVRPAVAERTAREA